MSDPKYLDSLFELGNAQRLSGETGMARKTYTDILDLQSDHVGALINLGTIFYELKDYAEAIKHFQRAGSADPTCSMAYNNMGLALVSLDLLNEAETCYRHALSLNPNDPEIMNNLGILFRLRGAFAKSKEWYLKALEVRPSYPEALNNLGNVLKDCGELERAISVYEEALRQNDAPDNHNNLAIALLAAGRLKEGWREYEWRWLCDQQKSGDRSFEQPLWRGEAAQGKTLLLHAEQGLGDTLQFCRYAPLAAAKGLRIVLEVQLPLVRLMHSLAGVASIVPRGQPLPKFDLHCPLLSLPLAFETELNTIPFQTPYLAAEPEVLREWRDRLTSYGGIKVGFVWAGKPQRYNPEAAAIDRRRSISPDYLAPLTQISGTHFFSLQKEGPTAPIAMHLINHMDKCRDFEDTAGLISNLDLVISVDTAVAHLAGALGKPVWLLNRFDSCWRWRRNRSESPWYPNMRLFNQPTPGDWKSVIEQIKNELALFVMNAKDGESATLS